MTFSVICSSSHCDEPVDDIEQIEQRDLKVLDAALVNLVGVKGEKEFVGFNLKSEAPRTFYFNRMANSDVKPDPNDLIERVGREKLERFDLKKIEEAIIGWRKRCNEVIPFENYKSNNKSIIVVEGVAGIDEKKDYLASYPLQGWSPGYSDDGIIAVLVIHLPELQHPSVALFLLEQKGETWKVVYRYVATYL